MENLHLKFFYDQNVKFNYSNSPTIFSTNILKNTSLIYEFGKIYRKILLKNLNTPHYQYLNSSLKTFSKYPLSAIQRVSLYCDKTKILLDHNDQETNVQHE